MPLFRIYVRVLALLTPEKWLAIALALANVALAAVFLLEPWLFGRVVDALAARGSHAAWHYIGIWARVAFFGVAAGVLVALYSNRPAHRRRLSAIVAFLEHALALPLSFHDQQRTGRLLRTLHAGSGNLFALWLSFFRSHLSTLIAIVAMIPLAQVNGSVHRVRKTETAGGRREGPMRSRQIDYTRSVIEALATPWLQRANNISLVRSLVPQFSEIRRHFVHQLGEQRCYRESNPIDS